MTRRTLRDAYDTQLRPEIPDPVPGRGDRRAGRPAGPDPRASTSGGFLTYRDLDGLTGARLDALIARQVEFFRERGESVEWKLNGHDEPADLADRLRAAGFVPRGPGDRRGRAGRAAGRRALPVPPEGVRLREVTSRADLERIAAMEEEVWHERPGRTWSTGLAKEIDGRPAVDHGRGGRGGRDGGQRRLGPLTRPTPASPPCGAVRRCRSGAAGASTGRWWRTGRGWPSSAGRTLLQVDCSEDSRPILERLGLVAVTTTTPYVYTP